MSATTPVTALDTVFKYLNDARTFSETFVADRIKEIKERPITAMINTVAGYAIALIAARFATSLIPFVGEALWLGAAVPLSVLAFKILEHALHSHLSSGIPKKEA